MIISACNLDDVFTSNTYIYEYMIPKYKNTYARDILMFIT